MMSFLVGTPALMVLCLGLIILEMVPLAQAVRTLTFLCNNKRKRLQNAI